MLSTKKIKFDFWTIITILVILVFALFLIYPLLTLFVNGFRDTESGVFTIANYSRFFSKRYYFSALLNSFKLTFSVTFFAVLLGLPLAYFMSFYKIKGKTALEIMIIVSMMSPNFIGAYSWILMLGRNGIVTQFFKSVFNVYFPSIYSETLSVYLYVCFWRIKKD